MLDAYDLFTHGGPTFLWKGRFQGAGAAVPTVTSNVKDTSNVLTTITRSATGNLVVQFLDPPGGVLDVYDFWVCSNNVADRNVRVTPPTSTAPYTFQLNVTYMANGVACDVALGEELHFLVGGHRNA